MPENAKATKGDSNVAVRFKRILVNQLGVNEDDLHGDPEIDGDLGADSLDQIEIIMASEVEFNLDITDEEAERIKTVGEAIRFLEEKVKA